MWAKQWLQRRVDISLTHLLEELQSEPEDYRNFLRMNETTFDELLTLVTPLIERRSTIICIALAVKGNSMTSSTLSPEFFC